MEEVTVYRTTPLPTAPVRGRLVVPHSIADSTRRALQASRGPDGRHEGLAYWAGIRKDDAAVVLALLIPDTDHGPQHVLISEREAGRVSRRARSFELIVVCQVHSHPGMDTRHSDGDDRLILMPHEGLFSLVVADYGQGSILPAEGAGLHQYQDGRWVLLDRNDAAAISIVPTVIEVAK